MLSQFFKVRNITLQLLILEPYHQISSLSILDPPAEYTPLIFFHLALFCPSTVRVHAAVRRSLIAISESVPEIIGAPVAGPPHGGMESGHSDGAEQRHRAKLISISN